MPLRAAGLEWAMRSGLDRGGDLDRKVGRPVGTSRCTGVFWLGDSAGVARAASVNRRRKLRVVAASAVMMRGKKHDACAHQLARKLIGRRSTHGPVLGARQG